MEMGHRSEASTHCLVKNLKYLANTLLIQQTYLEYLLLKLKHLLFNTIIFEILFNSLPKFTQSPDAPINSIHIFTYKNSK